LESEGDFLLAALGVLVLYGAIATRIAAVPARSGSRRSVVERLATVNVYASPLTVLGLYPVSQATKMRVFATGTVHEYPCFRCGWQRRSLPASSWLQSSAPVAVRSSASSCFSSRRRSSSFWSLPGFPENLGRSTSFTRGKG
jgi:hypothetical protein